MRSAVTAYIGLGSNLDDPPAQLQQALHALAALPDSDLLRQSPVYRSRPLGPADQPDYLNAVAAIETRLAPLALLDALQAIEQAQGRRRDGARWGPRSLDLDILLYGTARIDEPRLQVPHPGLGERNFVLYPMADIAAGSLSIPGLGRLDELQSACPAEGLELYPQC